MRIMVIMPASKEYMSPIEVEARRKFIESNKSPETEIEIAFPDAKAGPGILRGQTEYDILFFARHITQKAREAEKQGFDGVMMQCSWDPGIEAARYVIKIPIVGQGRVALNVASMLCDRLGCLTTNDSIVPYLWKLARLYRQADLITSIRTVNIPPFEIVNRKAEIIESLVGLAKKQIEEEGAEMILPWGGALIPAHISPRAFEEAIGVPVLDVSTIGLKVLEGFISMGISTSRKAYPSPQFLPGYTHPIP